MKWKSWAPATLLTASLVAGMTPTARAMGSMTIVKQATAGAYRLVLKIGPAQRMAMGHPKHGEVMLHGQVATCSFSGNMGMSGSSKGARGCNHHIELHVYNRKSGKVVTTAVVTMVMVDSRRHTRITVPIMAMMGAGLGMKDYHYGNNVYAGAGTYTVRVAVDKTATTFTIQLM
ncbi:MAG TPA: hypothetical protein VKX16_03520 [Chloroflexota bacterium]|nr:hypothetical protein [Chloroflexota bacterium]